MARWLSDAASRHLDPFSYNFALINTGPSVAVPGGARTWEGTPLLWAQAELLRFGSYRECASGNGADILMTDFGRFPSLDGRAPGRPERTTSVKTSTAPAFHASNGGGGASTESVSSATGGAASAARSSVLSVCARSVSLFICSLRRAKLSVRKSVRLPVSGPACRACKMAGPAVPRVRLPWPALACRSAFDTFEPPAPPTLVVLVLRVLPRVLLKHS